MLSTVRKVKGLTCRDIYFAHEMRAPVMQEDLQLFLQSAQPAPGCRPFVTSIVDLVQDEAAINSAFRKSTAYDVRRAKDKDLVSVDAVDQPTPQLIEDFSNFFDSFAASKGIGLSNRPKLVLLAEAGALTLSFVAREQDKKTWLAVHSYIVSEGRCRLLYSASKVEMATSEERQIIGRANKFMHWQMLLHFKRRGLALYDFGGISKREELKSIDEFKESFGGREVVEYNAVKGVSWKGKAVVLVLRNVQLVRELFQKLKK
jgi:hypothetical protein